MTRYLGQGAAEKIGKLAGLPPEEREVVAYGMDYLLSGLLGLTLMLFIGLALGLLRETLLLLFCWISMRVFAGGPHCTALWRCTIVNCSGLMAALLITKSTVYLFPAILWVAACTIWALVAAWLWAPGNSERPVNDVKKRRALRSRALVLTALIGLSLIYASQAFAEPWPALAAAGATGLAAGGSMLSPAGFRLIKFLDQMLSKLWGFLKKGGEKP